MSQHGGNVELQTAALEVWKCSLCAMKKFAASSASAQALAKYLDKTKCVQAFAELSSDKTMWHLSVAHEKASL